MARFDYPYRKAVNVTAWVLQIIVCLILLGASAWVVAVLKQNDFDSLYTYVSPCRRERRGAKEENTKGRKTSLYFQGRHMARPQMAVDGAAGGYAS